MVRLPGMPEQFGDRFYGYAIAWCYGWQIKNKVRIKVKKQNAEYHYL